ncbi:hypothetical protein PCASD_09530 [Puccinia coronata f. sp. avenae]|uniref:Uncharacterized protein n=1 Tax=Puccinia coronata f. sp. avenae TaxID=200324 RepID=A0A2N5U615_9BASI|nr:hypothetical protein PCASD_09530 [Puccinia coronata f. sp. avenae]
MGLSLLSLRICFSSLMHLEIVFSADSVLFDPAALGIQLLTIHHVGASLSQQASSKTSFEGILPTGLTNNLASSALLKQFLNNDDDIELPLNLANITLGKLGPLLELLIGRFSPLAAIKICGYLSTASILFRANTLLTKMLEAYMRIVKRSFLESSIANLSSRLTPPSSSSPFPLIRRQKPSTSTAKS